ncbi:hypothetical protein RhiirB3_391390 [Rhizophagus irregularis]|nr:hypothetical protein RhiirB3_391390 [Rhizophagus irregularis]
MWLSVEKRISDSILQLNGQRLLSINEVLSCIPLPLYYPQDTSRSISSTKNKWLLAYKNNTMERIFSRSRSSFGRRELMAGHLYDIIGQIYNYMSSLQLQYGVLSSYDNHWFLYRPKNNNTELQISHSCACDSTNPPVLKSYVYLARLAKEDPASPHLNINNRKRKQTLALQQSQQNSGSGHISQIFRSLSNPHYNVRSTSGDQGLNENQDPTEEAIGYGQTGGTYRCKFYGQTLALKDLDLQFFYNMKNDIKIYQRLSKIQVKYIPKLLCYGYYGVEWAKLWPNVTPETLTTDEVVDTVNKFRKNLLGEDLPQNLSTSIKDYTSPEQGKKRIIGEQGDRSKVEDAENEGGE